MPRDKSLVFLKEYIQNRTSIYTIKKLMLSMLIIVKEKNESERELYY